MAACSNCYNGTGAIGYQYTGTPNSWFGYHYTYPSTCSGGCLYMTSGGYRCSNSCGSGSSCGCKSQSCGCGGKCGGCGKCGGTQRYVAPTTGCGSCGGCASKSTC